MKTLALLVLIAPLLGLVGCATVEGDAVSLRAEQTIKMSFDIVDEFLHWEYTQRHRLPPHVSSVADTLRSTYPPANQAAWRLLREYRATRTLENRTRLERALSLVTAAAAQAQELLAQYAHP